MSGVKILAAFGNPEAILARLGYIYGNSYALQHDYPHVLPNSKIIPNSHGLQYGLSEDFPPLYPPL